MRPTPQEEIQGIGRILADVVAPAVSEEYPRAVLQQLVTALERLAMSWNRSLNLLVQESAALSKVLGEIRDLGIDDEALAVLWSQHDDLLSGHSAAGETFEFGAANARNQRLREALGEAIKLLSESHDLRAAEGHAFAQAMLRANLNRALGTDGG